MDISSFKEKYEYKFCMNEINAIFYIANIELLQYDLNQVSIDWFFVDDFKTIKSIISINIMKNWDQRFKVII